MSKPYLELRAELEAQPDHAERAAAAQQRLEAEDATYFRRLGDLRRARQTTQVELARRLNVAQPSLSKMERQVDLYVSTLRRCVEALGGQLQIHAVFPDLGYELRFEDFEQIDQDNPELDEGPELRHAL
jgi:transcriptional regulator with XRE-family HTH domain